MKQMQFRAYFNDYVKFYPEKWSWRLEENNRESRDLYMHFRARKAHNIYENSDKLPIFTSIQEDANQFGLEQVTFTDFFGIKWEGKKGVYAYAGDPDYEQHLYYFPEDDDYDDYAEYAHVSDEYTQTKPPAFPNWMAFSKDGQITEWLDMKNITDVDLHWVKENHLHKDSYIEVAYDGKVQYTKERFATVKNKDHETIYDIVNFICGLRRIGKMDLYNKLVAEEEKHFNALRTSTSEDEVEYAPKKHLTTDWNGKEIWEIGCSPNAMKNEFVSAEEYYDMNYNKIYGTEKKNG